jgi:general secretion pathway protein C
LLAANLFGQAPPSTAQQSLDSIPISSLNLVLTGVVAAGGASFALISVNGQAQEPFAIGQEVLSGATLRAVLPDRAILERGGVNEALMLEGMAKPLPDITLDGLPSAPPAPMPGPVAAQSPQPAGADLGIRQQAPNSFVVPRSTIDAQMQQPQQFLSQAHMVPNAGGGFLVREIQPGSVYEKLGLQVGDVIRSVNGQPVNSVQDAMRSYAQAKGSGNVRLEIVRAGRPEMLQYNVQ